MGSSGGTVTPSAAPTLAAMLTVDGAGSGLDSDLLDGISSGAFVQESDYDAHTVLAATSDNTPAALTVGEQTAVGRVTGGNIVALTAAQLESIIDDVVLSYIKAAATDDVLTAQVSGDSVDRFVVNADGKLQWGGGSGALDAEFYRQDANYLRMNTGLVAAGLSVTAFKFLYASSGTHVMGWCTGTPEGAVTAPIGSSMLRTDGGASTTLYIKESGTGNTGWVAK